MLIFKKRNVAVLNRCAMKTSVFEIKSSTTGPMAIFDSIRRSKMGGVLPSSDSFFFERKIEDAGFFENEVRFSLKIEGSSQRKVLERIRHNLRSEHWRCKILRSATSKIETFFSSGRTNWRPFLFIECKTWILFERVEAQQLSQATGARPGKTKQIQAQWR